MILSLLFPFETVHVTKVPTYGESPIARVNRTFNRVNEAFSKISKAVRASGVSCEEFAAVVAAWRGPPSHTNCRCGVISWEEEEKYLNCIELASDQIVLEQGDEFIIT